MSAIETFIDRVTLSSKSNSKELRVQMSEATMIVTELAALGARSATLADQVIELQKKVIELQSNSNTTPIDKLEINMDGGAF